METTSEFVKRLAENKKKELKNKRRGNGHPEQKLPNKQH